MTVLHFYVIKVLEPHTHPGYESDLSRISAFLAHERGSLAEASFERNADIW